MISQLVLVTDETVEELRVIRNSCASFLTGNTKQISVDEQRIWWQTVRDNLDWKVWLLEVDNSRVGYGIIRRRGDARWWLTGGLIPERRSEGLGAVLFELLIGATPAVEAWLDVRVDNLRARRLYEGLGFTYVDQDDDSSICRMVWEK